MLTGRLGRVNTAKHRNKTLELSTKSVHFESYRADPKLWKFEKAKINKTLNENIIEHT